MSRLPSLATILIALCTAGCSGSSTGSDATGGAGGSSGSGGHAGSSGNGASDTLCGMRPGGDIQASHVLRFETEDRRVVAQLHRTWLDYGAGESSLYGLNGFHVQLDGVTSCVTDPARLDYVNSHHNWSDVASADAGDVHYQIEFTFPDPFRFTATAADGSPIVPASPLVATGGPPFCWGCPSFIPVSISEVMLANTATLADEQGEYEPWIELYNPSAQSYDLSGWTLSNDFTRRDLWPLPPITIPPYGLLVLFADGEPAEGELHTSFTLDPAGGELILTSPDGTTDGGLVLEPASDGESIAFSWTEGTYVAGAPSPGVGPPEP